MPRAHHTLQKGHGMAEGPAGAGKEDLGQLRGHLLVPQGQLEHGTHNGVVDHGRKSHRGPKAIQVRNTQGGGKDRIAEPPFVTSQ